MSIYITVSMNEDSVKKICSGAAEAVERLCDPRPIKKYSELFSKLKPLFDLAGWKEDS